MKSAMKKFILIILILLAPLGLSAQTCCYKYLHNVKDEVKFSELDNGKLFYFTFTNNKNHCYETDENGVYTSANGWNEYRYIGSQNGVLVYEEVAKNPLLPIKNVLYFSSDYKRMNWRSAGDYLGSRGKGSVRVLTFESNPKGVPNGLY